MGAEQHPTRSRWAAARREWQANTMNNELDRLWAAEEAAAKASDAERRFYTTAAWCCCAVTFVVCIGSLYVLASS